MRNCAHEIPSVYILRVKNDFCLYSEGEKLLSSQCGKKEKNNLTITSEPYAHPHTMKKRHGKFHNNRYKTVSGVALTSGTNCLYIKVKMTKFTMWKK